MTAAGTAGLRCSTASQELSEPLVGTASTVRSFLLVEETGPWGVHAVRDSRLPREVKQRLSQLESRHRIRPLLIRRHRQAGRRAPDTTGSVRVFAAYVHTDHPWVETAALGDVRELLDLDLSGLGDGRSPGLTPHEAALFLVCTHGRHDACCAERGRPLATALAEVAPEHTWEVSHIGGDRFAANVLVLPHGLYYGRVLPSDAGEFSRTHLAGHLDLVHLRGRSAYPFPVQAAEVYLRRHIGVSAVEPLVVQSHERHGTESQVVFLVDGKPWQVRIHTDLGSPRQLTCRATSASTGFTQRLVEITRC